MIRVKLNMTPKTLPQALSWIGKAQKERAIRWSLNKALDKAKTTNKRNILEEANLKPGEVETAHRKIPASGGGLIARLIVSGRFRPGSYPLFNMRQGGSGTSFTPWKDKTEFVKGGFIARMGSGHVSVFKRGKLQRRGRNRSWLPIHDVGWGPAEPKEMLRKGKPGVMISEIQRTFDAEYARQYDRVVAEAKSKFGL